MADTWIDAGELDRLITLQTDVGTDETSVGEHIPDWQNWGATPNRWAGIRQLRGREIEQAAQLQIEATHLITLRWDSGITASKMRAVLNGRVFNFGVVNNVNEANVKLEILACERIA